MRFASNPKLLTTCYTRARRKKHKCYATGGSTTGILPEVGASRTADPHSMKRNQVSASRTAYPHSALRGGDVIRGDIGDVFGGDVGGSVRAGEVARAGDLRFDLAEELQELALHREVQPELDLLYLHPGYALRVDKIVAVVWEVLSYMLKGVVVRMR